MKNFYLSMFLLLVCSISMAQTVSIPDANFKNALLAMGYDANNNGEIEVSEALTVDYLNLDNMNIYSLQGIENFPNIINLFVSNNHLTEINLSNMPSLVLLDLSHNQLTQIDFSSQHLLSYLNIAYNQINAVDLPVIHFYDPSELDISGNNYTSIAFAPGTNLTSFICNDTHLTSLDLSNIIFNYNTSQFDIHFQIANNTQLQFVNLRNGFFEGCTSDVDEYGYVFNCSQLNFNMQGNTNLSSVCVDNGYNDYEYNYFKNYFNDSPNVLVTTYCSFTPGGSYNTITGNVTLNCSGNNEALENVTVGISESNVSGSTFTNSDGNFAAYTSFGTQTVSLPQVNPNIFTITPSNYVFSFPIGTTNTRVANFCLNPNGVHPDLEVSVYPLDAARPGFDAHYKIVYKNKGNQVQSGSVTLTYADSVLDYVASSPVFSSQATDSYTWNFNALAPFETRSITVTFNVNSPQETPAINNGDLLTYRVAITPSQPDETPVDNNAVLNQTVIGSLDPNDKTVIEGSQLDEVQADNYLHYIVRFQNRGTAAAENIVVKDMLSSNLDWSTLEMISSSHPFRSTLTNDKKLEVFYESINLPASSVDEPGSHGYIAFKVKPIASFGGNDVIENTANIYFDFNYPIATNTVSSMVVTLGNHGVNLDKLFTLSPNPTSGILNIAVYNNQSIITTTINNLLGQTVMSSGNSSTLDISSLTKGTYFITVETNTSRKTQKIIKL